MAIVTKQSLNQMLADASEEKRARIIGRALWALFERQTHDERNSDSTRCSNNIGFASCDAKSGSITAKTFRRTGTLQQWQVDHWMANSNGYPRICKYARQLNEIAEEKAARQPRLIA